MPPLFYDGFIGAKVQECDVTIGIIDSRSKVHPEWVNLAIASAKEAGKFLPVKIMVVDNTKLEKSVGYCLNYIAKNADTKYVFYLDDDDWIAPDIVNTVMYYADKNPSAIAINTMMTAFKEDGEASAELKLTRPHKGIMKRDYILRYPFDETLKNGVDRAYFDQVRLRGDVVVTIPYHYGYYYRQHDDNKARATGNITLKRDHADVMFHSAQSNFINPVFNRLKDELNCGIDERRYDALAYDQAKVIWCEWLDNDAITISNLDAYKILRLHAYEAFTDRIFQVDFNKFDVVIFVAEHIKDFVEKRLQKKLTNAIVVKNGIELDKFKLYEHEKNNKVVYAGNVERKKGIGELVMIAENFHEYEFHCAGDIGELDVIEFLVNKKPDNLKLHGKIHDMENFYKDFTYVINTSIREGNPVAVLEAMACGCKPVVRGWVGSDKFVPMPFIWNNMKQIERILKGDYDPQRYRKYVETEHNFETMYETFKGIITNGFNKNANSYTC